MKSILAFGASSSRNSINKKFALYAASLIDQVELNIVDLNDYELPLYSIDKENENGIPELAHQFKSKIDQADGLIISFAEHNGSYTAAYKNIYDWASRIESSLYKNKALFLLSTSPGGRGAKGVLEQAVTNYGYSNKVGVVSFSLPSFGSNFDVDKGILDTALNTNFEGKLNEFIGLL